MRRLTAVAVPLTLTLGVLLAGCGSAAAPASTAAAPSSAPATTSASATSTATTTGGATGGAASPAVATWVSSFCGVFTPFDAAFSNTGPQPDVSTPALVIANLPPTFTKFADIFGTAATSLRKVGPPPTGSITTAVDGFSASETKLRALAASTAALDPADTAASAAVVSSLTDTFTSLALPVVSLGQNLPPETVAAINATPGCKLP